MKILNNKISAIPFAVLCLCSMGAWALDLDLASEPLAIKTAPVKPNVMLLIDDSGSMGGHSSTSTSTSYDTANDLFYTPGYNFNHNYECNDSSVILYPSTSKVVDVAIVKGGLATFSYDTGSASSPAYYVLSEGGGVHQIPVTGSPVGSSDDKYTCKTDNEDLEYCKKNKLNADGSCDGGWSNSSHNITRYGFMDGWCNPWNPDTEKVGSTVYYEYQCRAKTDRGLCISANSYSGPLNIGGGKYYYRVRDLEFKFEAGTPAPSTGSTTIDLPKVCFDPNSVYKANLKADQCTSGANAVCTTSSSAEIKEYDGNFLNWYFSASSTGFFDFSNLPTGGLTADLTQFDSSFTMSGDSNKVGYKAGTKDNSWSGHGHERMETAKDVAAVLVSGLTDMNIGIASYDDASGADIDRILLELGDLDYGVDGTETTLTSNRQQLLQNISYLSAENNTPLAEAMAGVGLYYAHQGTTAGDNLSAAINMPAETFFGNTEGSGAVEVNFSSSSDSSATYSDVTATTTAQVPEPITSAKWCQKNFLVALTDGQPYNDGGGIHSSLKSYISGDGDSSNNNNNTLSDDYVDDVIKALFDLDLRPDVNDFNGNAVKNNVITYLIAFGSSVGGSEFDDAAGVTGVGGGEAFDANSGLELAQAFKSIEKSIRSTGQSITAVALSSVAELQTENHAYQASYDTEYWTGSLKSFFVNENGQFVGKDEFGNTITADTTSVIPPDWEAGDVLNKMYVINDPSISASPYRSIDKRKIFTLKSNNTGIEFKASTQTEYAALSTEMQADINSATISAADKLEMIQYIRGDITKDVGYPVGSSPAESYRQRLKATTNTVSSVEYIASVQKGSILGDIVHSSPVYVEKPPRPWNDYHYGDKANGKAYSDFQTEQDARTPMVYVGANDGMLHGFTPKVVSYNGETFPEGGELFAYIPNLIASTDSDRGLHYLSSKSYEHQYYVDMMPTVSDVFMDPYYSGTGQPSLEWRSVLVSGLRSGGKGVFALDVTCPIASSLGVCSRDSEYGGGFNTKNVLWEFGVSNDEDVGFTFSEPVIAKVNYDSGFPSNKEPNGNGKGRWAAIFNNGYESKNGRAVLFVVFLDGVTHDSTWTEGVDYLKLYASENGVLSTSSVDTASDPNGLSSPQAVDINNDGLVDRIYAGDLKGNMWVFNVQTATDNTSYAAGSIPWSANKLFTTGVSSSAAPQAITTPPMIDRDPNVKASDPNLMVVFGTGLYHQEKDILPGSYASQVQSIYAVHDRGTYDLKRYNSTTNVNGDSVPVLEGRTFQVKSFENTTTGITKIDRSMHGDKIDWSSQYGWYVDLFSDLDKDGALDTNEQLGERLVFDAILANQLFVFNSIIPNGEACSGGAKGWTMLIDWTTGLAPDFATFDANNDGDFDKDNEDDTGYVGYFNETVGSQIGRGGNNIFDSSGETVRRTEVYFGATAAGKRLGWEERLPYGIVK